MALRTIFSQRSRRFPASSVPPAGHAVRTNFKTCNFFPKSSLERLTSRSRSGRPANPRRSSAVSQYEESVRALGDYYRTGELVLGASFRESGPAARMVERKRPADSGPIGAIVFGSDQGLVGRFNE